MVSTEIRLITFFTAKDGEAFIQSKTTTTTTTTTKKKKEKDLELTVVQIKNSL